MNANRLVGRGVLTALSLGFLFAWFSGGSGLADASCEPVYGSTASSAQLRGIACQKMVDESITGGSHGPVHLSIWARTPSTPASVGHLTSHVSEIIHASLRAYETFAPVSWDIVVAIGSGLGPWRATDAARSAAGITDQVFDDQHSRTSAERCVIDLNLEKAHEGLVGADYRHFLDWVVAHELFHCVQAFNFPEHFHGNQGQHSWWIEGQAEYFPALVIPDATEVQIALWHTFAPLSKTQNLFSIGGPDAVGYANAVLFAYLDGPRLGSPGLYRLTRGFPASGEESAQAAYLASQQFGFMLDDFAMAFADGSLQTRIPGHSDLEIDPYFGQPALPVTGNIAAHFSTTEASLTTDVATGPSGGYDIMHIYRGRMILAPHKTYVISTSGGDKIDVKPVGYDWIRSPTGDDTQIETCDEQVPVSAVATEVDPHARFLPQVTVTVVEGAHQTCGEKDRCLVGRWQPDPRHIERITQSLGARANAQVTNGPIEISFFGDGRWQMFFHNLTIAWLSSPGAPGRINFANLAQGRWAASPSTGLRSSVMSDHTFASVFLRGRHVTTMRKIASSFGMVNSVDPGLPYRCVGDTLTFSQDASPDGLIYHRVSSDPTPVRRGPGSS